VQDERVWGIRKRWVGGPGYAVRSERKRGLTGIVADAVCAGTERPSSLLRHFAGYNTLRYKDGMREVGRGEDCIGMDTLSPGLRHYSLSL
jgi:hypothetical protein